MYLVGQKDGSADSQLLAGSWGLCPYFHSRWLKFCPTPVFDQLSPRRSMLDEVLCLVEARKYVSYFTIFQANFVPLIKIEVNPVLSTDC